MKRDTYIKMTNSILGKPILCKTVIWANRLISLLCYGVYILLILVLCIKKEPGILGALLVPGISFFLISIFRYWYNAPRPYEVFGVEPVMHKETKGKSFPSRHIFSIFVIGVTLYYFYPLPGVILGVGGVFLGMLRIVGGVHFMRDVVAGAAGGLFCGIVGFYFIRNLSICLI